MTPTELVLKPRSELIRIKDVNGRDIVIRHLNALDKLRLLKAAGPVLSENQAWLGVAMLAASVIELQGVPIPIPINENQIETIVGRLGDVGLDAIADSLANIDLQSNDETGVSLGN